MRDPAVLALYAVRVTAEEFASICAGAPIVRPYWPPGRCRGAVVGLQVGGDVLVDLTRSETDDASQELLVVMLDLESLPSITCRTTRPVVIDPTADQFGTPVPYAKGKGKGFLTLQPSKRAQALLAAAGLTSA